MGALTQLWAGTSIEGAELNGKVGVHAYLFARARFNITLISQFLIPWARARKQPLKEMQDLVLGAKLWKWFQEQVKNV